MGCSQCFKRLRAQVPVDDVADRLELAGEMQQAEAQFAVARIEFLGRDQAEILFDGAVHLVHAFVALAHLAGEIGRALLVGGPAADEHGADFIGLAQDFPRGIGQGERRVVQGPGIEVRRHGADRGGGGCRPDEALKPAGEEARARDADQGGDEVEGRVQVRPVPRQRAPQPPACPRGDRRPATCLPPRGT